MPCAIEFEGPFIEKLKGCSLQKRNNILAVLEEIKQLEKPDEKGGAYQKSLWAYMVPTRTALIAKIDIEAKKVLFRDIILHL